jgi:hypothetical protein
VLLNCDTRNVAGILDQLQVDGVRIADFTIKEGEIAQDLTFAREEGARPDGRDRSAVEQFDRFGAR